MRLILHSAITGDTIRRNLGKPEYSYYFVLRAFRPVLEQIGTVTVVERPEVEVDPIFRDCAARGEACVFICFSPPNLVPLDLECPSLVVFAWEFDTLPDGGWPGAAPGDDWRVAFRRLDGAISLSSFTAGVVKAAMGAGFPVFAVAAPVFDRLPPPSPKSGPEIWIAGEVIDSRDYALSAAMGAEPFVVPRPIGAPPVTRAVPVAVIAPPAPAPAEPPPAFVPPAARLGARERMAVTRRHLLEWYREALRDLLPPVLVRGGSWVGRLVHGNLGRDLAAPIVAEPQPPPPVPVVVEPTTPPPPQKAVQLDGVVYTSVFNPADGRKNWHDLLTAFCWAFRDVADATLVLKLVKDPARDYTRELLLLLTRLSPFKCRIVAIDGFLEDLEYRKLIGASHYYVNVSNAEGLCLPLMEFMSAGVPVIAPRHTAMLDYVEPDAAFIIGATPEHNVWPNDPRHAYTTMRQRPQWDTIVAGFTDSYQVATWSPARHAEMGRNAARIMRGYCADDVIRARLEAALHEVLQTAPPTHQAEPPALDPDEATSDFEILQPAST